MRNASACCEITKKVKGADVTLSSREGKLLQRMTWKGEGEKVLCVCMLAACKH